MDKLIVGTQTFGDLFARPAAAVLLAALTATTVLLQGCGGGGADSGGQTAGQTGAAPDTTLSAAAPPLGIEQSFAVLAGSTVKNTGPSRITGNLGVSPGTAVTGFPPGLVQGGTIHAGATDEVALQGQIDNTAAYLNLADQTCPAGNAGVGLGGNTLVPGVYCFSSSAQLTGALTLDAGGVSDAVWVFQIGSTLTTASSSSVVLINGAQSCNVFWQVGSSATLGGATEFVGNIHALASITLVTGANVKGRLLAQTGAVTLDTNNVGPAECELKPGVTPPTVSKSFNPVTISAGDTSVLTITMTNANSTMASLTAQFVDTLPPGLVMVAGSTMSDCIHPHNFSAAWFVNDTGAIGMTGGGIPKNGSCTVSARVRADFAGTYVNTLRAGALQTSNGNNADAAEATLTVN